VYAKRLSSARKNQKQLSMRITEIEFENQKKNIDNQRLTFFLVHDNFQFRPSKFEVVLVKNWYLK
jgi:hypothetical protein